MPPVELRAAERGEPVATDRHTTGPAAVDRLLTDARRGAGGCLVLRGEPGSGKTALLEYAVSQAVGMHPVRVAGIESESRLGFAAAHQLLVPFLSHVDRLPPPQRDALRTVAGLVAAPSPDRFLVGLAMLTLLAEAARDRPLLITIDDTQWLDQTSAQVLGFVARRVQTHPIAVLAAVGESAPRDASFAADRLGLGGDAAVAAQAGRLLSHPVVRSAVHHGAAPPERRRVHAALAAAVHPRPNADDQLFFGRSGSTLPTYPGLREVRTHPLQSDAPIAPGDLLRDGFSVRRSHGYPAAVSKLRAAVTALLAEPAEPAEPAALPGAGCDLFAEAGRAAADLLDDEARYVLTSQWVAAERDRGDAGRLPDALSCLARVDLLAGRMASVEANLAEARGVVAVTNAPAAAGVVDLGELTVLAWRGRAEEARSAAARLHQSSAGVDPGTAAATVQSAMAVLELASGCYRAALTCALEVYLHDPPDLGTHVLPDLVEAASRAGDRAAATAALERFAERALASGTPLALGLLARSRALLADDAAADGLYQEAGDLLARTSAAPQLARTYLLHGEWLRRQRRRRDARQQLQAAADLFESMGMDAFAQRARVELRATSDRVSKRVGGPDNHLTPQESQIAQLVADGLANRDIAGRLFISPSTVEYHLQKVFRKLEIGSRTQLARALLIGIPSPAA